jgi:hypothetical protein
MITAAIIIVSIIAYLAAGFGAVVFAGKWKHDEFENFTVDLEPFIVGICIVFWPLALPCFAFGYIVTKAIRLIEGK